jgi:hypothetical protein
MNLTVVDVSLSLQTGQNLDVLNTEQQMAEAKQQMEDDMEADAELLGIKKKKKQQAAAAATDDNQAATAAGGSTEADEGLPTASTAAAHGEEGHDELVGMGQGP